MKPSLLSPISWLVRDTFRQALASRIFWIMLGVSALVTVVCLSIHIEGGAPLREPGDTELYGSDGQPLSGPNPNPGHVTFAFGAIRLPLFRDREAEVLFLQALLAKWVAGLSGLVLALVWTAGFLPEFLQPSAASVLLAKPIPRWTLLLGKYVGVVAFVAFQAVVFFLGTWLALGAATGVFAPAYLLGIPLVVLGFAFVYSFSVLLAVLTRSTIACALGSILFLVLCFGMNYGRHAAVARPTLAPELPPYPTSFRVLTEVGYWVLPKPADLVYLLDQSLQTRDHFQVTPEFAAVDQMGEFYPEWSLFTSLLFIPTILFVAARQLATTDY